MSDSESGTTMLIRRRIEHWKTSVAGIASILCPIIAIFLTPEWKEKVLTACALLSGGALLVANDPDKGKALKGVVDQVKTITGKLPCALLASVAALLIAGCAFNRPKLTETVYATNGTKTIRSLSIPSIAVWPATTTIEKQKASLGRTFSVGTDGLVTEGGGTNAVEALRSLDSILGKLLGK